MVELRTQELKQEKEKIEKINLELALKTSELEKLSLVASETDNGVLIADADGKVEWVNDGFTRISGYTSEDFQGRKLTEISLVKIRK
ncbi:PAS domain-containing protein [candidate division KSB1 bacterium]|nr:PAS domain-containing protein [candidate division KSB1 bacterium]NIT74267.1 PAS domain-containing protein [candidate division KSB1 bacterium]NIX73947.1 PAS domain-containing protein [candidate division KSB1 bacterium]